jgi:hypothetical protein
VEGDGGPGTGDPGPGIRDEGPSGTRRSGGREHTTISASPRIRAA